MPLKQDTIRGHGFNLKDSTGRRWLTPSYRTEAEVRVTRKAIEEATDHVLHVEYMACREHLIATDGSPAKLTAGVRVMRIFLICSANANSPIPSHCRIRSRYSKSGGRRCGLARRKDKESLFFKCGNDVGTIRANVGNGSVDPGRAQRLPRAPLCGQG
jgi:hypothetical protein